MRLEKISDGEYKVYFGNGRHIGEFLRKEDGFFDYWPTQEAGYWPAYALRAIADKLDELNKDWADALARDPLINGQD